MDERQLEPGIISPELDCESFVVDGVVYTRTTTLTVGRARILEKLTAELQYGCSFVDAIKAYMAAKADLNAGKLADGLFKFGQFGERLDIIGMNRMPKAELVGLFYNAQGEDPADLSGLKDKVYTAWRAVDRDFFSSQAFQLLTSTRSHYLIRPELAAQP